jgi:hypothetical protein
MENLIPQDWSVEVITRGRDGNIVYHENSCEASFYWEFGGRDVIAIIHGGPASEWNEKYPWAADRRDEVLERVIKEVIRQKVRTCIASVDEESGEILLRNQERAG